MEQTTTEARVLAFDASELVARAHAARILSPRVRFQAYVRVEQLFPLKPQGAGRCLCGCGQKARRKWATDECAAFGNAVLNILKGHAQTIRHYLGLKHGPCCCKCWCIGEPLQADHILPLSQGGGGLYLDNYQLLCHACHVEKTAADQVKYGAKK